jgi:hypothetical protein
VYLSLKYTSGNELYLEKILKYSVNDRMGYKVIREIIRYMKARKYNILRIRVYPLQYDIGTAPKEDVLKLVHYYKDIGFEPVDNIDDVTGKEAFEMTYTIKKMGGDKTC